MIGCLFVNLIVPIGWMAGLLVGVFPCWCVCLFLLVGVSVSFVAGCLDCVLFGMLAGF